MNELSIMQMFADPNLINELTTNEKVIASLITTLIGMGTTFSVLCILWLIISLMCKFMEKQEQLTSKPDMTKDEEVIAAIAGAVRAYQGSSNKFIIRRIVEKSKVEERLITPVSPVVTRKYNKEF